MDLMMELLPEGASIWAAGLVAVASFFTAALTAAFGLGGGVALLAVMSAVFPAAAVVPVHGAAQAGANAGRFFLQRKAVVWRIVRWFGLGGLIGAALGGRLALEAPVWLLRAGVGGFALWTLWGPSLKGFTPGAATFFLTGIVTGVLTMFFGATGPLIAAMLSAASISRHGLVATHAAAMMIQHMVKISAFGVLGFAYREWAPLIAVILIFGFAGTYMGTHYLRAMPEATFRRGFKAVLTAIAVYLLAAALADFRTG